MSLKDAIRFYCMQVPGALDRWNIDDLPDVHVEWIRERICDAMNAYGDYGLEDPCDAEAGLCRDNNPFQQGFVWGYLTGRAEQPS